MTRPPACVCVPEIRWLTSSHVSLKYSHRLASTASPPLYSFRRVGTQAVFMPRRDFSFSRATTCCSSRESHTMLSRTDREGPSSIHWAQWTVSPPPPPRSVHQKLPIFKQSKNPRFEVLLWLIDLLSAFFIYFLEWYPFNLITLLHCFIPWGLYRFMDCEWLIVRCVSERILIELSGHWLMIKSHGSRKEIQLPVC